MSAAPHLTFTKSPLDRASHLRTDEAFLAAARQKETARFAAFRQLKPLVEPKAAGALWLTGAALKALGLSDPPMIFLGLEDDVPCFAVDISAAPDPTASGPLDGLGEFVELRATLPNLPADDAAILGHGKAMLDWHARHGFCAQCGAPTESTPAGERRDCPSCKAQHFPRTDPVVIMLATRGDRALLGQPARLGVRFFSALAGFLEPGETIEDAVKREVHEETGVTVANIRYAFSQPWPFPSSLMIGCYAEATSEDIRVDPEEIADARWFTRAELAAALDRPVNFERLLAAGEDGQDPPLRVPPPFAIAHHLIRGFVEGT